MIDWLGFAYGAAVSLALAWFVIFLLLLAGVVKVPARNLGQYDQVPQELREWFRSLHNGNSELCCANADGYDAQWDTKDGHLRVYGIAGWVVVPDKAVVREPNKVGVAKVWWADPMRQDVVICFLEGTEG
jgi:hypothetical protein